MSMSVSGLSGEILWEDGVWDINYSPQSSTISTVTQNIGGYSTTDALKFTKYANYYAQAKITIPVDESLFWVSVDFYGEDVDSWSWAPGLKIRDPDNGKYAYIKKEDSSYARWGISGYTSPETYGTLYDDVWYTFRILFVYGMITIEYKQRSAGSFTTVYQGYWGSSSITNNLEIILGTPRVDDYSGYQGSSETYYYDNILYKDLPLNGPKLVGEYKLDSNVADSSTNFNHGTSDNVEFGSDHGAVEGGSALFNGYNSKIDLPSLGNSHAGTLAFWVNIPAWIRSSSYLMDGRGTGNWWLLQSYKSGACVESLGNVCFNGLVEIPSSMLVSNQWHHIVVTADPTESKIYLDGNFVMEGNGLAMSLESIRLGARYTYSNILLGYIDEVQISNYALSQSEITTLYSSYPIGTENPTISYETALSNLDNKVTVNAAAAESEFGGASSFAEGTFASTLISAWDSLPQGYQLETANSWEGTALKWSNVPEGAIATRIITDPVKLNAISDVDTILSTKWRPGGILDIGYFQVEYQTTDGTRGVVNSNPSQAYTAYQYQDILMFNHFPVNLVELRITIVVLDGASSLTSGMIDNVEIHLGTVMTQVDAYGMNSIAAMVKDINRIETTHPNTGQMDVEYTIDIEYSMYALAGEDNDLNDFSEADRESRPYGHQGGGIAEYDWDLSIELDSNGNKIHPQESMLVVEESWGDELGFFGGHSPNEVPADAWYKTLAWVGLSSVATSYAIAGIVAFYELALFSAALATFAGLALAGLFAVTIWLLTDPNSPWANEEIINDKTISGYFEASMDTYESAPHPEITWPYLYDPVFAFVITPNPADALINSYSHSQKIQWKLWKSEVLSDADNLGTISIDTLLTYGHLTADSICGTSSCSGDFVYFTTSGRDDNDQLVNNAASLEIILDGNGF